MSPIRAFRDHAAQRRQPTTARIQTPPPTDPGRDRTEDGEEEEPEEEGDEEVEGGDDGDGQGSNKRKASLADALMYPHPKKAKKSDEGIEIVDPLAVYTSIGRWIPRAIDPFCRVSSAFYDVIKHADEEPLVDEEFEKLKPKAQQAYRELENKRRVVNEILDLRPGLEDEIGSIVNNSAALATLLSLISKASHGARSDDSTGLKHDALDYVVPNPHVHSLVPKIFRSPSKSDRGFNHPMLARLLCPAKYLKKLDTDPNFINELKEGKQKVRARHFPAFLYENLEFDKKKMKKGLLRGLFLLRVYRHIFTSPSSSTKAVDKPGTRSTRSGNAKIHGLTSVTPRTIAYAAIQARFVLSTLESWAEKDGKFNFKDFYERIVKLFDNPNSKWCSETLEWWDRHVFGEAEEDDESDEDSDDDDFAAVDAQQSATDEDEDEADDTAA